MQDTLFSPHWYRVCKLSPRVRPDTISSQHTYRDQTWHVLKGPVGGGSVRINAAAYYVLCQFDGERTVGDVWEASLATLGDDAPTQDELIQLLGDLFDASVVDFEQASDLDQLFENRGDKSRADKKSRFGNPLFMRFALFNPNRLAHALLPYTAWLFTRATLILWVGAMLIAGLAVAYSWPDLTHSAATDLMSRRNLIIMWFVFPIMKLVHELAHAVAVRRFGGEVHECGIAMLVLLPVPYVDASDSSRFSNKYHRIAVAAAGILVETGLASLGLAVWIVVEPGLLREIALNVFITGTLSSVLFNGNPLLKFDAYYVLSDALEMPNLAARASRYPIYLIQRFALGMDVRSPAIAKGERRWLLLYGLSASIYRIFLSIAICLYVASQFFFVGVALAIWSLGMQIGRPLGQLLKFLFTDPRLGERRLRVNLMAMSASAAVVFMVFVAPVPHVTAVRGVVWPVDHAVVRTNADCFVESVLVKNGSHVPSGAPLLRCNDAEQDATLASVRADHTIARAALDATRDRVDRQLYRSELNAAAERLRKEEDKQRRAIVASSANGEVYFPDAGSLVGSYLKQGTVVGYVLNRDNISIRTLLAQERADILEQHLERVTVRMLRGPGIVEPTKILRRVPAASANLSIAALGEQGGGDLLMEADEQGTAQLQRPAFELELELPLIFIDTLVGEPVELRFTHGSASVATLLYRRVQLLLLSKFNV